MLTGDQSSQGMVRNATSALEIRENLGSLFNKGHGLNSFKNCRMLLKRCTCSCFNSNRERISNGT